MSKIRKNPDGSISFNDERYRLEEREPQRYEVVRERDGTSAGAFRLLPDGGVEVESAGEAGGEQREIVEAVANLLEMPRGSLPLQ